MMKNEICPVPWEDLPAVLEFANRQFSTDLGRLQPHLYGYPDAGTTYGCFSDEKLVGMLSVYPYRYRGLHGLSIGTVCTDINSRGRGIMGTLFTYLEHAVFPDYDLLTLAGRKERYERFGFAKALCFPEYQFYPARDSRAVEVYPVNGAEANEMLFSLFVQYGNGVVRRRSRMVDILTSGGNTLYLLQQGSKISYVSCRKRDRVVTEYCGTLLITDVVAALSRLWGEGKITVRGVHNSLEPELLRVCDSYTIRNHGNIRINHGNKVIAELSEGRPSLECEGVLPLEETYALFGYGAYRPPDCTIPSSLLYLDGI